MNRLFGQAKSSAVPKTTLNDTAATLDLRVEVINKQIAAVDQDLQAYSRLPPAKKASQKSRALALLNKKKMYERQRATIEGQASNIGATAFAVENVRIHREIYNGLADAKQQIARGYRDFNVEKVGALMDDLDDHLLDQEEMNDVFSRPIGQETFLSDADLETELADLAESEFGYQSNTMDNALYVPSVPVQPINVGNTTTRNDAPVDEFGLPKARATGMRN